MNDSRVDKRLRSFLIISILTLTLIVLNYAKYSHRKSAYLSYSLIFLVPVLILRLVLRPQKDNWITAFYDIGTKIYVLVIGLVNVFSWLLDTFTH